MLHVYCNVHMHFDMYIVTCICILTCILYVHMNAQCVHCHSHFDTDNTPYSWCICNVVEITIITGVAISRYNYLVV